MDAAYAVQGACSKARCAVQQHGASVSEYACNRAEHAVVVIQADAAAVWFVEQLQDDWVDLGSHSMCINASLAKEVHLANGE